MCLELASQQRHRQPHYPHSLAAVVVVAQPVDHVTAYENWARPSAEMLHHIADTDMVVHLYYEKNYVDNTNIVHAILSNIYTYCVRKCSL